MMIPLTGYPRSAVKVISPSGDPSGVTDAANIMAAVSGVPPGGGQVTLAPTAPWYIKAGQVIISRSGVYLDAPGTFINATGTGDTFRFYDDTVTPASRETSGGGITGRPVIDGTSAGPGSCAVHAGDIIGLQADVAIQNFTGAGDTGLNLDNAYYWTEEADIRAYVTNCTQPVQIITTTGYNSFGYNRLDFSVVNLAGGPGGIAVLDGAALYHGSLRVRGNFVGSASPVPGTAYVLYLAGINTSGGPADGYTVALVDEHLDIQVECNPSTYNPGTIYMDQVNYAFAQGNYGILSFSIPSDANNFSHASFGIGQFVFSGEISGDTDIAPQYTTGYASWVNAGQPVLYSVFGGYVTGSTGQLFTDVADFQTLTLSASVTISLTPASTLAGPQRVTVVITQAASGGPYTVTWPHAASPSVSAPTVKWAAGTAPTMSTGAGATDMYELSTADGITWIGHATQNVS